VYPIPESPPDTECDYKWPDRIPFHGHLTLAQRRPRRRRRTFTRDDRERLDFDLQVKQRRREIMEQRSSMMSGSHADEDAAEVDWTRYDPPEALNKLPNITSETIIAVVQSSLENIKAQIQAEKQRTLDREAAVKNEAEAEAEAEAAAAAEVAQLEDAKGKANDTTPSTETVDLTIPLSALPFQQRPPNKQRRPSRFGISRILRHVRGPSATSKSESNSTHIPPAPSTDLDSSGPTPFTQFIYKHLKPHTSHESLSGETAVVECVSCLDDVPKTAAIKTICHHYCADCFSRLIATAIENEAQWPPKCCLSPVPFRTITKHASPTLLASYRAKAEEFRVPASERIYCPFPDCGAWIPRSAQDPALRLGVCPRQGQQHRVCTLCRGPAHPGDEACPQDRDLQLTDRLAEEEGWRRCVRCKVLVEHKEACEHMTCRCGAQFCFVCGREWRTCGCGMEGLAAVKERARQRREKRTALEEVEAREMAEAVRLVEEFQREEARKEVLREEEARRKREERERREGEERERREEARRKELDVKYAELRGTLDKLEELQKMVMEYSHDKDVSLYSAKEVGDRDKLRRQHEVERREVRAATAEKIKEREGELEREYRARVAWERKLEEDYEAALGSCWQGKIGGLSKVRDAMRAYMRRNDGRMEAWQRWKGKEMEQARYLLEDEVAIRDELMDAAKRRLEEKLAEERVELGRKQTAEGRWFELVVAERKRLLSEVEMVERENGGDSGEESSAGGLSSFESLRSSGSGEWLHE
jgi:hypothetical protein